MNTHMDHLVVAARTLEQGVLWAQARLGITPGPGGSHPRYGTHNRLFKIATPSFPWAYLEIIAIDPQAAAPAWPRWFDLDDPTLQAAIAEEPRLIHWVANTDDLAAALAAWHGLGLQRGPAVQASRQTTEGLLQWQITVRDDGQRLMNGALPSLIQWGAPGDDEPLRLHPRQKLPRSKVSLHKLILSHPDAQPLQAALAALGLAGIEVIEGPARLCATLRTPKGQVLLESLGI